MVLLVAVPCGLAAAVAYGVSTALQHDAAHTGTGRPDVRALPGLARNPRWLASLVGDTLALALQSAALATGPVLLVAPLLVLAVPTSLLAGWMLGGPGPRPADGLACGAVLGGLAGFFALLGTGGAGNPLSVGTAITLILITLAAAVGTVTAATGRSGRMRAVIYGGVAGCCFGVTDVLINAASLTWQHYGVAALTRPETLTSLTGVITVGGGALVLTQISFQSGTLAASYPANECTTPLVAVALAITTLGEHARITPAAAAAGLLCLAAVVAGTLTLARPVPPRASQTGHCPRPFETQARSQPTRSEPRELALTADPATSQPLPRREL